MTTFEGSVQNMCLCVRILDNKLISDFLLLPDIRISLPVSSKSAVCVKADRAMGQRDLEQEFEDQFNDVVSRLQSKQLFQSDWDIASFAVFFIFIGELKWRKLTMRAKMLWWSLQTRCYRMLMQIRKWAESDTKDCTEHSPAPLQPLLHLSLPHTLSGSPVHSIQSGSNSRYD